MESNSVNYWDAFYTGAGTLAPLFPSQFAAFVLGEVPDATDVVEFGCGTGRDSEFFASNGLGVTGLDLSERAIMICEMRRHHRNTTFRQYALGDPISDLVSRYTRNVGTTIIYARFFLHAIDEAQEDLFLATARDLSSNSTLALEYRCVGDEVGPKEFGTHYRRFIDHDALLRKLEQFGFAVEYQVTGRGFAKYKSEDAVVGRCIARRK